MPGGTERRHVAFMLDPYVSPHDKPFCRRRDRSDQSFGSICAVDDISVQVAAGEVYGVLGPNGAGKTTLLRMLFGLIRPDSGTIRVFGKTWDEAGVGVLDGVAGFIESPSSTPT